MAKEWAVKNLDWEDSRSVKGGREGVPRFSPNPAAGNEILDASEKSGGEWSRTPVLEAIDASFYMFIRC